MPSALAGRLSSFLCAAVLPDTFLCFLSLRGAAFIWNFEHFSTLVLTLTISGAVLSPCYSGQLVAPLSGQFYFPLTFHPRIRRAFVGCRSCLCLPRLKLCARRSPVESDPDEMGTERVLVANFNVVTVCEIGIYVFFLRLRRVHRRTFMYIERIRSVYLNSVLYLRGAVTSLADLRLRRSMTSLPINSN